eukprot:SAG25_NODE_3135_length_1199_cov_6.149461_2_plen_173_part_00
MMQWCVSTVCHTVTFYRHPVYGAAGCLRCQVPAHLVTCTSTDFGVPCDGDGGGGGGGGGGAAAGWQPSCADDPTERFEGDAKWLLLGTSITLFAQVRNGHGGHLATLTGRDYEILTSLFFFVSSTSLRGRPLACSRSTKMSRKTRGGWLPTPTCSKCSRQLPLSGVHDQCGR